MSSDTCSHPHVCMDQTCSEAMLKEVARKKTRLAYTAEPNQLGRCHSEKPRREKRKRRTRRNRTKSSREWLRDKNPRRALESVRHWDHSEHVQHKHECGYSVYLVFERFEPQNADPFPQQTGEFQSRAPSFVKVKITSTAEDRDLEPKRRLSQTPLRNAAQAK